MGVELNVGVEPIRSHQTVFPIRYANEGSSASFNYSHGEHFHDPHATHTRHYSEEATRSPINIGGADYHTQYTYVAIEDQHVPYQQMNTNDANYNPIKHVAQRLLVLSLKLSMTKPPLRELLLIPMIYNA